MFCGAGYDVLPGRAPSLCDPQRTVNEVGPGGLVGVLRLVEISGQVLLECVDALLEGILDVYCVCDIRNHGRFGVQE